MIFVMIGGRLEYFYDVCSERRAGLQSNPVPKLWECSKPMSGDLSETKEIADGVSARIICERSSF